MRILTLFFNYSGFPCSEGGVQVFGGLWWQFIIEKMVDFWCYLFVLMMGLKVFARVARWIFVSNGGFAEIPIKSRASVILTKSTYCIFPTIIP